MSNFNHTMPTDLLENCTDGGLIYCYSEWANAVTGGFWWIAALLGFCFVLFMATIRFGTGKAFGFASFAGMLGAFWLSVLGLITWWIAAAFIIVGLVGIAVMKMSD